MTKRLTLEEWFLSEEAERLREESYLSGQEVGRIVGWLDGQCAMRERASDLVRAIRNEVTVTDYHYRNGWRDACSYAEMRIRALEVKP